MSTRQNDEARLEALIAGLDDADQNASDEEIIEDARAAGIDLKADAARTKAALLKNADKGDGSHLHPRIILRKKPKEYTPEEILSFTLKGIRRYMPGSEISSWLSGRPTYSKSEEDLKNQIMEQMRKEGI